MAAIDASIIGQKNRPIIFALYGSGVPLVVPFGIPAIGLVRPESLAISRTARGTVTHTAADAFLEDFGEGVPQLTISGHTGWNQTILSGLAGFKLLEGLFVNYLQQRRSLANRGADPNAVKLLYIDTLNLEAFSLYPHEFVLERTKARPLLYLYRMRFSVLLDLLQSALYGPVADFLSPGSLGGDLGGNLLNLGSTIFGTGPATSPGSSTPPEHSTSVRF